MPHPAHTYFGNSCMGEFFFYRLVAQDTRLTPAAPLLRGYAKVESLSIAELTDFVLTAPLQEIDFICTGRVTGVKMDKGWCYVSCSHCAKKLQRTVASFTCLSCNNTNAVGVLRYRVEMSVADETGEALFVCFDEVLTKLHNIRAYEADHLLAGDGVNPEETHAPPFVTDMEGKTCTFQVRMSSYNFTANHQTFTISRILSERKCEPQPAFVDDGGEDDNGDDNSGGISVAAKVKAGGISQAEGASDKMKKACKA
ncbi:hypothetical protein Bca101_009950 [Brassica carinata]